MKQQSPLATVTCLSIALVAFFSVQVDVTAFSNYVSYPNLKYARESATLHGRRGGNDEVTGYVPSGLRLCGIIDDAIDHCLCEKFW
eukprot:CAMPEP_0203690250 /NCGR_PEP_ID=MMETSP0091-20130426/2631_1 /ASSEMBLY_ACC=CAM_ASM_001089 /TAXON_ID=426623 /ORGANISM="Chaetoceros affinis, Strain CCMP159" /LENGTH=85 /DNA_ID=CAMNT_0050560301 /DNA_START=45 /DNA_END=299 /DNA_ORIENTATION=+